MADASSSVWLPVLPDMSGFGPAVIKGAGKEADKSGKTIGQRFGTAINAGVAAIAAGAVATGTALYKIGETFDSMADTIRAGTGATGKDLDGLIDVAKNVGRNVPAEFDKIGTTVADLNTRLGLSGDVLDVVARQYLEAGRILGEEIDVNQTAAAFKAFHIEAEKIPDAMDTLFRASQATGVGMNELAAGVQKAGPALTNLGFSFADSVALMGSLDKAGLNSQQVAASLTRSLTSLAKSGEEPADAFQRIIEEMKGYVAAGDTAKALELSSTIFGTRGASQFVSAIQSGVLELDNLTAAAGVSEDSILGVANETMDFSEHWQVFKNDILTQLEPAAKKLFDAITDGMTWVRENGIPILKDFGAWLQNNEGWLKGVAIAVGGIVAVWKTYQITLKLVAAAQVAWNVITTVGQGIVKAFTIAQRALNAVLKANPIGLVVTAITLLVAGFVTAYNKSETFRTIVEAAWNGIKAAAEAVWNFLKTWVFEPLGRAFAAAWEAAKKASDIMSNAWNTVKDAFVYVWNWIDQKVFRPFKLGIEVLKAGIKTQVDNIKNIWDGIKTAFMKPWEWIKTNVFNRFKDGLSNLRDHVRKMKDAIGDAWKSVANKFRDPINWVLDKVWNKGIAKAFNKAAGVLNLKTRISTEAQIPKFAKGGYHKGGWALVGEEGPELVNFSNPSRIYTAAETSRALGGVIGGQKATDTLPAIGGGGDKSLAARAWDGLKSAGSAVVGWVRGGLASAAGLILRPIRSLISKTVSRWGTFGDFAGGAMTQSIDSLMEWIRGKDDEGDAGGIATDMAGGKWRRPSRGPVTSRYGRRNLLGGTFHAGIDIAGGGPTFAAAAGKVYKTGWNILRGRSGIGIGIDHGAGTFTYYGHNPSMSAVRVKPGDTVRAGQHIGAQGATGNVTGVHLHFELHKGGWGRAVNPSQLGLFDEGGWLQPGMAGVNLSSRPEPVFTSRQWDLLRENVASPREAFGRHVTLRVGEREFDAYVEETTDARLAEHVTDLRQSKRQLTGV